MRLVYAFAARQDLDEIHDYVANDNPYAARRLISGLIAVIDGLTDMPDMGRPGRRPGTRELVIPQTSYIAVYVRRSEVVEVLRVLHGRRRWPPR